uniref:Major facilitator superfamily (MFS) profile domain-containing protein n=1 Tax=Fagus sylvatica TaxID=28930 RepID=A0A2N9FLA3_FAGSY
MRERPNAVKAVLAYSRERNFFYVYYVFKTLTAMVCEGSVHCLALAYVADNVPEAQRASSFGILSGIGSAAFVCGTLSTRFLSTSSTFQVAATVAGLATVYMRVFLPDSIVDNTLSAPILSKEKLNVTKSDGDSTRKTVQVFKTMPSFEDMLSLLKISSTFSQAAIVAFFSNLADVGLHASVMYYLKASFHFNKNQFADLMVISGITGTISQLLLMPMLVPALGEEKLLSIGLFFSCVHMFLYSIAWSFWVPYVAAMFSILYVFSQPCMRSIVSKQVGSCEQGMAQGCISGICSFANVVSPLAFSPLTDDSLCSEYDDKGSSSHIKSQRQQLQPRRGLVLNNVNAQKLEASPPYYHPKAFHLYLHILGRNIEVSSCNNYLALILVSIKVALKGDIEETTPEPVFEKHINDNNYCMVIFLGHTTCLFTLYQIRTSKNRVNEMGILVDRNVMDGAVTAT